MKFCHLFGACVFLCVFVSDLHYASGFTHSLCFQGMNFIAGYLIIITKDEEKAFWLMDALLGRMLPGRVF